MTLKVEAANAVSGLPKRALSCSNSSLVRELWNREEKEELRRDGGGR